MKVETIVAIVIAVGGGAVTTAINWGSTHARLDNVEIHQKAQDSKEDALQRGVTDTQVHAASADAKLDALQHQLDRIESKL